MKNKQLSNHLSQLAHLRKLELDSLRLVAMTICHNPKDTVAIRNQVLSALAYKQEAFCLKQKYRGAKPN